MALPEQPNFIIIGAQRCATRWLRVNLGQHPDVFVPAHELNFFSDPELMEDIGPGGYRRMFAGWEGEPVVGELSPRYAMPASVPAKVVGRITWSYPDVRLLMIIRNPYDRMLSAMLDAVRTGEIPEDTRLDHMDAETLQRLGLIENSAYEWAIGPFQEVAGDAFKVLVYDDLLADHEAFFDEALEHIGLEPGFRPSDLATPLFGSRRMRGTIPVPDDAHRQSMLAFWERSTENVERLIGRELPGWHPR